MKILLKSISLAYSLAKDVSEEKISRHGAIVKLIGKEKMNQNSAMYYIDNFVHLIKGEKFARTLNASAVSYFFERFVQDYGQANLDKPLSALSGHIEYYEGIQKTTMYKMRAIHQSYSDMINSPVLIESHNQLVANIRSLEYFLNEGKLEEKIEASRLLKRGICFVAYQVENETRFAPSRYVGYQNNKVFKFEHFEKDGMETNDAINNILDHAPEISQALENNYEIYCRKLGIGPSAKGSFGVDRKFWKLNLTNIIEEGNQSDSEFPEGKMVERSHKARERNSKVVQLAKQNFKKNHGKLFCQVCGFDYEKSYGALGKDFIEGHHTLAVSEMSPDYKTKPEEIAMLCSNCHRMVHRKRPWVHIDDLSQILKRSEQ